jgi:hypothetical protein
LFCNTRELCVAQKTFRHIKVCLPLAAAAVLSAGSKAASPFPDGSGSSAHDPYWAVISEVRELHTAASDRSCVHIEIDISSKRCVLQRGMSAPATAGQVAGGKAAATSDALCLRL